MTAVFVLAAIAQLDAVAQTTAQTTVPPAGDPEVYASFFHFHDDFMKWVGERSTGNPEHGQKSYPRGLRHSIASIRLSCQP